MLNYRYRQILTRHPTELESQFFAWLREKGVQVNGVDMRKFDRMGRGLVANKSLEVSFRSSFTTR
jgi:phage antirepressor YoqD-like protein